jgi:hypothetical protein
MVYTDGKHLAADSLQELYEYADKVGLDRDMMKFMGRNVHPHFEIFGKVKSRVLQDDNVKQVSTRELVRILKLNYRLPETDSELQEWEAFHNKKLEDLELPSETDYQRMIAAIMKRANL